MKREVKKRTPTHVVVFVCAKVHVINENVFPIGTRIVAMLSIRNFFYYLYHSLVCDIHLTPISHRLHFAEMAGRLLPIASSVYMGNVFYSAERSDRE